MIKYKFINKSSEYQKNLRVLQELWKDNWLYVNELDWVLIFTKKVVSKQDREEKQATKTPEFIEFISIYPKKNWLSDNKLIEKYSKLWDKHLEIMEWLRKYINWIEVEKKPLSFVLMASTFINQERRKDDWKVLENRFSFSQKWIADKLQGLSQEKTNIILEQKDLWEKKMHKDITPWVLDNIIEKYWTY